MRRLQGKIWRLNCISLIQIASKRVVSQKLHNRADALLLFYYMLTLERSKRSCALKQRPNFGITGKRAIVE
jgi:hypothetical protein